MTVPEGTIASLAMYPFAPLRAATDELWAVIRGHLGGGPLSLEWVVVAPEVWRHPHLLLAQACGWPLVTELMDRVAVVGTFDYDVPGCENATYRSVIVSRVDGTLDELRARPDVVAAINGTDSLSGWVSLQVAWGGRPPHVLETGAHLQSVRALADGRADVASIDAVTWSHVCHLEASLAAGLRVIGEGPRVPCLPIVAGWRHASEVPALRAAFAAAVADPAAAAACATLRIRGFMPLEFADYAPLRTLVD